MNLQPGWLPLPSSQLRKSLLLVFLAIGSIFAASLAVAPVSAAPITFNTALPVAQGEGIFRIQARSFRASLGGAALDRDLEVGVLPLVAVYGASRNLALFTVVPIFDKQLDLSGPSGQQRREVSGLGDITLLARYTVLRRDRPGRTFRIAPFIGVEMPTGDDDRRDSSGRLPPPLQLGSGSWDVTVGSVATWQTLDWQIDTSISYRANDAANNFEFGDATQIDFSYQHRLLPRELGPGLPRFLYGVLEANLVWADNNRAGRVLDPNSGGFTVYLAPGLQLVGKRLILEAAVQIPVSTDLNGTALEPDYRAILSTRINW